MMPAMTWLAEVSDLAISFPELSGGNRMVVDGVEWQVSPGEAVGLVGESGSGKTMSVLALMGLVPPPGAVVGGRVAVQGRNVRTMAERDLMALRGGVVGLVLQEPLAALNPVRSIGFQVAEAALLHGRVSGRRQARHRAEDLLAEVGLTPPRDFVRAYPHQLSGGQRQRALLAAALAGDPVLLVADEPASALDPPSQVHMLELLASLQSNRRLAVLLISHDVAVCARLTSRLAVVLAGETVESGTTGEILASPVHPYTRMLVAAMPGTMNMAVVEGKESRLNHLPVTRWPPRGRCRFADGCPDAMERCRRSRPALADVGHGRRVRCFLAHEREEPNAG